MRRHDALLPHLTAWKWWYAGLAVLALVVGSNASLLLQFAGEDAVRMQKLLDVIEDLDDVQAVYHNAAIDA